MKTHTDTRILAGNRLKGKKKVIRKIRAPQERLNECRKVERGGSSNVFESGQEDSALRGLKINLSAVGIFTGTNAGTQRQ